MSKFVDISIVGIGCAKPPKGMKDYRAYRIEYGGHRHECLAEDTIWLHKDLDTDDVENVLMGIKHE